MYAINVENIIAVNKNIETATNDLRLNLAIPQSPCPLVHPLPSLVPNPTRKPARAKPGKVVGVVIYFSGPKGSNPL